MTAKTNDFVKKIAQTKTKDTLFNPYNEYTKSVDGRTAPGIRQQNLRLYLNSHVSLKTKMLWVYSTPTNLEAKRSGIPLVNTTLFAKAENILETSRSFEKATKSRKNPCNTVMSATLWNVAEELRINPILWPVLPFYTHKKGNHTSGRNPTDKEILKHKWFFKEILTIYQPKTILAIGSDAKKALNVLGIKATHVKHPRSGKEAFKKNVVKFI